jgi:hypothetical protein
MPIGCQYGAWPAAFRPPAWWRSHRVGTTAIDWISHMTHGIMPRRPHRSCGGPIKLSLRVALLILQRGHPRTPVVNTAHERGLFL